MTCIAAMKNADGTIVMAADQQTTSGSFKFNKHYSKLMQRSGFMYGIGGSVRLGNILKNCFVEPKPFPDDPPMKYLVETWVPAWMQCLDQNGFKKLQDNKAEQEGLILIAHRGFIYTLWSDFSITFHEDEFACIGSGRDFAIGAIHAMHRTGALMCRTMVTYAVEAAIAHDCYCGGNVDLMVLGEAANV